MRLKSACEKNGPLCVGLDTDPSYIPPEIRRLYDSDAEAVLAYNRELIEAAAEYAGCFKVQIAYYEAMGIDGLRTYSETLRILRAKNIPVIADIKRGDIADTARAYARAHFCGDFESDIITVNPYMGFDTLEAFTTYCCPPELKPADIEKSGKGFFVLLRTSNKGMADIEKQPLLSGGIVLDKVGSFLREQNLSFAAKYGADAGAGSEASCGADADGWCSPIGAVVGCTEESDARALRDAYPQIFFLIPGYGAQGGAARIAAVLLDKAGGAVNSSRGILCAWKKAPEFAEKAQSGALTLADIAAAGRNAALAAKNDLLAAKRALHENGKNK